MTRWRVGVAVSPEGADTVELPPGAIPIHHRLLYPMLLAQMFICHEVRYLYPVDGEGTGSPEMDNFIATVRRGP